MKNVALCFVASAAALSLTWLFDQPTPAAAEVTSPAAVPAPVRKVTPSAAPSTEGPVLRAAPQERAALPARRWDLGLERVYRVETSRQLRFERNDGQGAIPAPMSLGLSGELSLSVREHDDALIHVEAVLRHATIQAGPGAREAAPELEATFIATYERSGHLVASHFSPGTLEDGRRQLQALMATLQLVVPDTGAASWTTEERDVAGEYDAEWTRIGDREVQRSKRRYRRVVTIDGLMPTADIGRYDVSSSESFLVDDAGWPTSLSATETLKAGNSSDPMTISTDARTTARLLRAEDLGRSAAPIDWDRFETSDVAVAPSFEDARKNIDTQRVGRANLGELIQELAAIPDREDPRSRALAQSHARLAALFRVKPDAAEEAMVRIVRGEVDAITSRQLIGALGSAGTPEAQRALTGALSDTTLAREHRLGATVALGLTPSPNAETVDGLLAASQSDDADLAHASTLAAGSAIGRARTEGTADVKDAVEALIDRLATAESPAEAAILLDALGNSGDPRALPAIRPYLEVGHAGLRAAAVSALRFIAAPELDAILDGVLLTDMEPEVRGAALFAINLRDVPAHLPTLLRAVRAETFEPLRSGILAALLPHAVLPEVNAVLTQVAESDASQSLRSTAASALDRLVHPL